ncbi:MAG TPA: cation-translocating P-type ATPase [Dissulfurispiraceae bacterium]|nr:cation-translocating P-type ATPase [Dissulfurispiraceae bacterium]
MQWHEKSAEAVLQEEQSSVNGLTAAEAGRRLGVHGSNVITEKRRKPPFLMLLDQFNDFMIIVLLSAAVISWFIGEAADTITIIVIVIMNAAIGFVQEYRAEKAIAVLRRMTAPSARVRRDGLESEIPAAMLVPGDIILLVAGDIVPADCRLIETAVLLADESALTGESVPVEKNADVLQDHLLSLPDRKNMAYQGTVVTYGRGTAIVIATGMHTQFGKIAAMLAREEEVKTPLQKRLSVFSKKLSVAVLVICAMILAIGIIRGEPFFLMLLTSISLAVAAIPEALPAVITVSLALGARKLMGQNALIRKLLAVETLGAVTYICSDKTGTITLNRMEVSRIYCDGAAQPADAPANPVDQTAKIDNQIQAPFAALFTALALSNDVRQAASGEFSGDSTEVALCEMARRYGFSRAELESRLKRVAEIPFSSERKCMTTLHHYGNSAFVSYTKGAIDILIDRIINVLTSAGLREIDREAIRSVNEAMTSEGLRVVGIAMKSWEEAPQDISPHNLETGLTFLGLVGMMDPPRKEAQEAVAVCKSAGIRPVMITGDHPLTAVAVARKIGIIDGKEAAMTGPELQRLSQAEFKDKVEYVKVYARVSPEQKLSIVRALQDRGQFVAMTGDGVNDAPALKRADIGIAMGITGSDVAKQAAHMVLLDDNFATIVNAVREGRKIYDNIRKFIKYLLTTNSGEILTLFLAPFFEMPIPLLPVQILWINLVTDGLPALALSGEPAEGNVMKRPPRPPRESIFAGGLGVHAIWVGLLMAFTALFVQAWAIRNGNGHWQSMVFTMLCLTQLGHCLAIRSERESLFKIGLLSNKYLLGAVAITFVLQMAVVYVPFLNPIFGTQPLAAGELVFVIAMSAVVFCAVEIEKFAKRRFQHYSSARRAHSPTDA